MKILAFLKKITDQMDNQGLGRHSDKISAEMLQKYLTYPFKYSKIELSQKIWDMLEKRAYWASVVR